MSRTVIRSCRWLGEYLIFNEWINLWIRSSSKILAAAKSPIQHWNILCNHHPVVGRKKVYSVWFTKLYMENCSALQLQFPQLDFDEAAGCCFYGIKSLVIAIDFRFYFTWIQDVISIKSHSGRGYAQCLNFYLLHFRFLNVPTPLSKYFI